MKSIAYAEISQYSKELYDNIIKKLKLFLNIILINLLFLLLNLVIKVTPLSLNFGQT